MNEFITRQEAAEMLDVNVRTVDRLACQGRLQRYIRLTRIVFRREDVERLNEPVPVVPMPAEEETAKRDWIV